MSHSRLDDSPRIAVGSLPKAPPAFVEPMKCKLVDSLPNAGDWLYELKFDGFRALAIKSKGKVQLLSRNHKDLSAKFPEIAQAIQKVEATQIVLDGEIVALDEQGRPSFELLQNASTFKDRDQRLYYYAFDLINLKGRDLTSLPLDQRKALLSSVLSKPLPCIRLSSSMQGDPQFLLKQVRKEGLEGIIGKQSGSKYEAGQRSGAWIKYKCELEQEFVIAGYSLPQGHRHSFGALLVGYYEDGQLQFASKVGTGFTVRVLEHLFKVFQPLIRTDCPFVDLPESRKGRWGNGIMRSSSDSYVTPI